MWGEKKDSYDAERKSKISRERVIPVDLDKYIQVNQNQLGVKTLG